ncbi:MAG TPA: protein-disulfide reductase DsbD N-terminal domain-containing protein [Rhizomicrobium sp.]
MHRIITAALAGIALLGHAAPTLAQSADPAAVQTVNWTVTADPADTVKQGGKVTLTLHGEIADGWHVYSLKQLPNGPTPLRVTLDQNEVAIANGAPVGSPAIKIHDQGFNLDTQFYSHAFTVALPVQVATHSAEGAQHIPVSVRFQTCNDRVCQPPKTVHLTAAVSINN